MDREEIRKQIEADFAKVVKLYNRNQHMIDAFKKEYEDNSIEYEKNTRRLQLIEKGEEIKQLNSVKGDNNAEESDFFIITERLVEMMGEKEIYLEKLKEIKGKEEKLDEVMFFFMNQKEMLSKLLTNYLIQAKEMELQIEINFPGAAISVLIDYFKFNHEFLEKANVIAKTSKLPQDFMEACACEDGWEKFQLMAEK